MKKSELKKRLIEALTPDEASKVDAKYKEIYAGMVGKNPLKMKKYDNPDKVAYGRAINLIQKESLKLAEKLGKKAKVGDYIEDFTDSDAPQFKGKSDKKKKQMAVAAFLNKEEQKLDEIDAIMEKEEKLPVDKNRLEELVKSALMRPISEKKFPDLNDDGKVTKADVLIGRGVKLKEEEEDEKEFVAINAIIADLNDKIPQFKTIDTPDEYLALLDRIVAILIKESPSFVGSGRFITANVEFYNRRKDYNAKAKAQGEKVEEGKVEEGVTTSKINQIFQMVKNLGLNSKEAEAKFLEGLLDAFPYMGKEKTFQDMAKSITSESFKSLSKDIDKQKGKTKEDGDNIAGYIANIKRTGGGKGPTAKQKKRMAETILKELRG